MANTPDCDEVSLNQRAACYRERNMDAKARLAIQVRAMVLELQANAGTDYRTDLPGLLQASCKFRKMDEDRRDASLTAIYTANAEGAGATVPANAQEWRNAVNCYLSLSINELDAIWHELQCQLGYHATIV